MDLKEETALALISGNLASMSVIIVYHLFAIQEWTQKVQTIRDEAVRLSFASAPSSLERKDARRRREALAKRFPVGQVVLLGVGVLCLALLGTVAAVEVRHGVSPALTVPPLLILPAVYVGSSMLAFRAGSADLREATEYLGEE